MVSRPLTGLGLGTVFSPSLFSPRPDGGQQKQRDRSKLAAAGGFGLGWAGLCLPVGSLVGFEMGSCLLGMDDCTRLYRLPFGSPSKLFRVRSGLYLI